MSGNTIGKIFKLTTFGESHGSEIGGIIDGCPAGLKLDYSKIQKNLNRRRPGQSSIVTLRNELDKVYFVSGIYKGVTTGTPIGFKIYNQNIKSQDYSHIKNSYRPSHSDFTYDKKYGFRDYRGGGRYSARETISRVVAGSIAKQLISDVSIYSFVSSVGEITINKSYSELDFSKIEDTTIRCPDLETAINMIKLINKIKNEGDSLGGTITCVVKNLQIGLGTPVFDKLHADLGKAMLTINAVKGFEYGSGFLGSTMKGSIHNDLFNIDGSTKTNYSGGIQGGISNGMDIYFRISFKPVSTIMLSQNSIDPKGNYLNIKGKGRHDFCVLARAVPIVESMTALVLVDHWLLNKLSKIY
jgi:chorismate synthase